MPELLHEANSPPVGAAAGSVAPGARRRSRVPSALISQISVDAFAAGKPVGVAPVEALGPAGPAGTVTSSWPAGVQVAFRIVPASARRLSLPHLTFELLNEGGTAGGTGAGVVVKWTTTGVGATEGFGVMLGLEGLGVGVVAKGLKLTV